VIRKLTNWIGLPLTFALFLINEPAHSNETNMAVERSKNTTLIYFKEGATPEQKDQIVKDAGLNAEKPFMEDYTADSSAADKVDWFIADMSPEKAREYIAEKNYGDVVRVARNAVVYPFDASCDDTTATALPTTGNTANPNITTMGGPLKGTIPNRRVWIIDSGVYTASNRLNIDFDDGAGCTQAGQKCKTAVGHFDRIEDNIGHGTFIAGIIAGKDIGAGSILGMLPGAKIVPIKVFDPTDPHPDDNLDAIQRAVDWVLTDAPHPAVDGDVVNISWGMHVAFDDLIENGTSAYTDFENDLHQLADKGVKIAVAAGNVGGAVADAGGYVELLSPARLGGYQPSSGGGAIVTVSGIDATNKFWPGSFFGNGRRPRFAAPSVNIQSLWITDKQNTCTGTSFAAAHISGALLQSNDFNLTNNGASVDDLDSENDPITICNKNMTGTCDVM
jgi:hypothetical protein